MTEQGGPAWQWRWYFSPPARDHYVIARVWSDQAVDTITAGEDVLVIATGEIEEVIRGFVNARLPNSD